MATIRFDWEWLTADESQGLCGPEIPTFAALEIWIDNRCLTSCRSNSKNSEQRNYVVGPLSGLADWLVDHWMEIFWQSHTPFPKERQGGEHVPNYDDILKSEYQEIDVATYGQWYACHCLGHSASDLALPNLLLIPEDTHVGIAVGPVSSLRSTCTFVTEHDQGIAWISKADLATELEKFVSAILEQASEDQQTTAWAAWLRERFAIAQKREHDLTERRRALFGIFVADCWPEIEEKLGQNARILDGILIDSGMLESSGELTLLIEQIKGTSKNAGSFASCLATTIAAACLTDSRRIRKGIFRGAHKRLASEHHANPFWASIHSTPGEAMLPAFERGYRRAERVRHALDLGDAPIDIREVLNSLEIGFQNIAGPAIARSAYMVTEAGAAEICLFTSHPRSKYLAARRFSLASALGGLFASQTQTLPHGGANSDQARWTRSQEAKAFAAMFLLPASTVEANADLDQLVENYGISRTAASWHLANIRQRQQRSAAGVM